MRELTAEEILQVSGGCADFSGVTSTVSSTAEIVDHVETARLIQIWSMLR